MDAKQCTDEFSTSVTGPVSPVGGTPAYTSAKESDTFALRFNHPFAPTKQETNDMEN